jgi:putative phosphoribosyl transferase
MLRRFPDRAQAGRLLARRLESYARRHDVVVLGLPRGGVPVAYEVARTLDVPLDVFVVRKLGVPQQEELAMGAIASGGVRVLNREVVESLGIPDSVVEEVSQAQQQELQRREELYRGNRPLLPVEGRVVILIDDGLATGSTMRAAVHALRDMHPAKTVVAVPTGASSTCRDLQREADEVVCLTTPEPFYAVGLWYENFEQTTDQEVRDLLQRSVHV